MVGENGEGQSDPKKGEKAIEAAVGQIAHLHMFFERQKCQCDADTDDRRDEKDVGVQIVGYQILAPQGVGFIKRKECHDRNQDRERCDRIDFSHGGCMDKGSHKHRQRR